MVICPRLITLGALLCALLVICGCSNLPRAQYTAPLSSLNAPARRADTTISSSAQALNRALAVEGARHPIYQLRSRYKGEDTIGVHYFGARQRAPHRAHACGDVLCDTQGVPLDPHLELAKHARRNGKAIFVIDPEGKLWVTFDQRYGRVHHSSLVAGGPVLAAGELLLEAGHLLSISNESGHYHPPPESIDVALVILNLMGIDTSQAKRYVIAPKQRLPLPP